MKSDIPFCLNREEVNHFYYKIINLYQLFIETFKMAIFSSRLNGEEAKRHNFLIQAFNSAHSN